MNNILNFKFVNSIFCNDNDDILMKMEKDNMHPNQICTDSIVLRQHKMGKKKTSRKNQQNSQNVHPSSPQALSGTSGTCACSLGQVYLRCLPSSLHPSRATRILLLAGKEEPDRPIGQGILCCCTIQVSWSSTVDLASQPSHLLERTLCLPHEHL